MAGRVQWEAQVDSNVAKLLQETKELRDQLDGIKNGKYDIKLNVDDKKLENVISNLDKMLNSLGKGTGDFKQFENLSKELSGVISEVHDLSKAFGKVDDSGTQTLLSSIQSIDKSLSSLSDHILNVNKDFGNVGKNASNNVQDINSATTATEKLAEATKDLGKAQQNLNGNKSNISSENENTNIGVQKQNISSIVKLVDNYGRELDEVNSKLLEGTALLDKQGKLIRLYHGSDVEFDKFDLSKSTNSSNQIYGKGAYLIENEKGAQGYGNVVTQWYANVRAVLNEEQQLTIEEAKKLYNEFGNQFMSIFTGKPMDFNEFFDNYLDFNPDETTIVEKMKSLAGFLGKDIGEVLSTIGYDAIKMDRSNGSFYTIFDPDRVIRFKDETQKAIGVVNDLNHAQTKSTIEDVFQEEKIGQTTSSAKELDKVLEQVNIPTESFDEVLSKLDLAKSELQDIVKITKQSVSDSEGKFHDSYTLKDSRGSTEIYGLSSNTEKGQLLRSNIIQYDAKETEQTIKAVKEAYEYNQKLDSALSETRDKLNDLQFPSDISNEYKSLIDYSEELSHQLKNCEISAEQYTKKMDTAIQKFDKLSQKTFSSKEQDSHNYWQGRFSDSIKDLSGENKNSVLDDMRKYYQELEKESSKVSEQEAKEIQKVWEDNLKAITDYMDAKTKLNNLEASDKKSNKKSNEITDLTNKVEEAKLKAEEARATLSSMVNPHDVDIDTWDKWLKMMEEFRQAGEGSSQSIAKLKDAIANVNTSELTSIQKYIDSAQSKLNTTDKSREDSEKSSDFKDYVKQVQEYIDAIVAEKQRLENALESGDIEIIDESQLSKIKDLKQNLVEANLGFKTIFKGSADVSRWKEIDTITKYMEKNTRISKEAKIQFQGFIEELKTKGADANVEKIHQSFLEVCDVERKARREGQSFLDVLRDKVWYQWAAQIGTYFSFNDIMRYGKEAVETIIELDTALVDLKKTTAMSSSQMEDFYFDANDVAKEMGATTKEIIEQASAWSRLNKIGLLYGDI